MLTYTELIRIPDFAGRLEYLHRGAMVGARTFGGYRYLNQAFYTSKEWRTLRNNLIVRDNGCDLAHPDYQILDTTDLVLHHLNPITPEDLENWNPIVLDPENLVVTTSRTHKEIHYGVSSRPSLPMDRRPNDTCPWKL